MSEWNISKSNVGSSSWNPFSSMSKGIDRLGAAATAAVTASALGQQIEAHRQREEHNKRIADAAQQDHEKWLEVGKHVMSEEAKDKQHQRNLEILKLTKKVSEPGTQMDVKTGDVSVRATKKTRPQKPAAQPAAAPAPSQSPGWATPPLNAKQLSIVSKPAAQPAAPSGPQPLVGRGAGGRMVSLKPNQPKKQTKKKITNTAPTVARGAGGRMVSLKKQVP